MEWFGVGQTRSAGLFLLLFAIENNKMGTTFALFVFQ